MSNIYSKTLACINKSGSSDGAIRYIVSKIKKHKIKVELFMSVEKSGILRMFLGNNDDREEFIEFNDGKKYLKNISNQIFAETNYKPEFNIVIGDLYSSLKNKILSDSRISSVIFGATNDSWNEKKLPSLMKKFFSFSTIPLIIIPKNITETQINLMADDSLE
jgi:hypothetical protein